MPKNAKFVAIRKKAGFATRYALSKASGVSEAHLRQIELGTIRSVQFTTGMRLAKALRTKLEALGEVVNIKDQEVMIGYMGMIPDFGDTDE